MEFYQGYEMIVRVLEEPHHCRPNESVRGIWRLFLKTICYDKDQLQVSLGPWYARISTQRHWRNYYTPETDILHRQNEDGVFTAHRRLLCIPTDPGTTNVPIDVYHFTDGWHTARYQLENTAQHNHDSTTPTFLEYLSLLPDHEASLLRHTEFLAGEPHEVCSLITSLRETLLVTDGGAYPMALGWHKDPA